MNDPVAEQHDASPGGATLSACISRHAKDRPNDAAIMHGDLSMSWRDLETAVDHMAASLQGVGVRRGSTVAIGMPRSIDQIVAALAVMRTSSACLPLSPATNVEMQRCRLADCGVTALFAEGDVLIPRGLCVDTIPMASAQQAEVGAPVAVLPKPDDVAWIAAAAGGREVAITHANLTFLAQWMQRDCGLKTGHRVCHMADPGSSAATLEVWPTLAAGATVVIMDEGDVAARGGLSRWISDRRIDVMIADHDALSILKDAGSQIDGLRIVITGTDMETYLPDRPFHVVAIYGPEECTLVSAARRLGRNERTGGRHIGKPIHGAAIHILDDNGELVPTGEEGDLWIGGRGVGRGYRNRPDLTAERFVPDPFGDDPAGMIFKTGGRGRVLIGGGIDRRETRT